MPRAEHWPPPQSSADQRTSACWTTGAKDGVGGAVSPRSRVWFTLVGSVLTEVYYPTIDQANTRDLRLVLTGPNGVFADERHHAATELTPLDAGVPGYRVRSRFDELGATIDKLVLTDNERPVVLVNLRFALPEGLGDGLRAHVLLSPHIGNQGEGNDGWLGRYKGVPMLLARRGERALALAYSGGFVAGTCTHVGLEDAWHDLRENGALTRLLPHAFDGNLLLAAELDLSRGSTRSRRGGLLALAFGDSPEDAGQQARAALRQRFACVIRSYVSGWRAYQRSCRPLEADDDVRSGYRTSLAVLRVHADKAHTGASIASLAIPWGDARGDHDGGGYHLVWARDLCEIAGGLLAVGLTKSARLALLYLMSTQEASGHWPQNMWLDGKAYWRGVQLDEAGLPILLAEALDRHHALQSLDVWPMVRRAASYIVKNGPVTPEDRWEERAGYSPFTLSVEIAALVVAAHFAAQRGCGETARYLEETADYWNSHIEHWTYVSDTKLSSKLGVHGYYVRLAPPRRRAGAGDSPGTRSTALKNHPIENTHGSYEAIVSPDALALVRFGLRAPNDPRMRDTIRAIDALLRTETPTGPVWHRFTGDHYGEHEDGSPFDGDGIGRGWPLLAGERAHYEVARGDLAAARALRRTMLAQSSPGGLIPEQVWDADDIPAHGLVRGRPSGSAMPLAWAHAEYVKLCRSIEREHVFDTPPLVASRYLPGAPGTRFTVWRADNAPRKVQANSVLRVEHEAPFRLDWHVTQSSRHGSCESADTGLGVYHADVPVDGTPPGAELRFTPTWRTNGATGREHTVRIAKSDA